MTWSMDSASWITCILGIVGFLALTANVMIRPTPLPSPLRTRALVASAVLVVVASCLSLASALT
jgi:hypothetical protein